ncbi:MAG: right-handed parallel beta-helix repeat-containing protein, partial [Armatimonadota bacterium]
YHGKGAYPGYAPVLYVDGAKGDDTNQGGSADAALRTLAKAVELAHPGHTIYLMPATYTDALTLPFGGSGPEEPLVLRAWGRSPDVVLAGGASLASLENVMMEGLTFVEHPLSLAECANVKLRFCVFADQDAALQVRGSQGIVCDHLTFARSTTGVQVGQSEGVAITNSLFDCSGAAIACDVARSAEPYCDYNAYSGFRVTVADRALTDLQHWRQLTHGDEFSRLEAVELLEGYMLPAASPLRFAASDYSCMGARPARPGDQLPIEALRVAALSPESATLLWETPGGATESGVTVRRLPDGSPRTLRPVSTFQVLGAYFDMTFRTPAFFTAQRHVGISGLEPGQRYQATVTISNVEGTARNASTVSFTTPRAAQRPARGRVFYISRDGNDEATGESPAAAWRTFERASGEVGPGDRVVVLPGVYCETLRPRTSGTRRRPIIYESAEPQKAIIDLMGNLPTGIEVMNADYVHVRGFRLEGGAYTGGHNVLVANARGIRISGCQVAYPPGASFDRLTLGYGGLVAVNAPDLTVDNNLFLCGYVGVGVSVAPGTRIINNTIVGEGNYGIIIVPGRTDETYEVTNNILYRAIMGYKISPALQMMNVRARLRADYNLYYIPEQHKGAIGRLPDMEQAAGTLEQWQRLSGLDEHSVAAEPLFVDPEKGDFRLRAGSPGSNAAQDGGAVGFRDAEGAG